MTTPPEYPEETEGAQMDHHPAWCTGHEKGLASCFGATSFLDAPGGFVYATPWLPRLHLSDGSVRTGSPQVVVGGSFKNPSLELTTPENAAAFAELVDVLSPDHELAAQVRSAAAQAWQEPEAG